MERFISPNPKDLTLLGGQNSPILLTQYILTSKLASFFSFFFLFAEIDKLKFT